MTGESSFIASLLIHRRVVGALLMREILTRYGRDNIGFLWVFGEPMLFTIAVTTLWSYINESHGAGISIVAFVITGYPSVLIWRNMTSHCVRSVQPNHTLFHHRNIRLIDIYSARILLEWAGATMSFTLLSTFFITFGWMDPPKYPLEIFFGWAMQTWFGCSLALFVGALSERMEVVHTLWHPISYILFPLSGVGFSVDSLRPAFQDFVLCLPMVHGVEIIREGYFGAMYHAHYNVGYMAACNLTLMLLGLTQVRVVSRQVVA